MCGVGQKTVKMCAQESTYNVVERKIYGMTIDTNTMISITEANRNFSKVARVVDEHGSAVILKNNVPRHLVIDFNRAEQEKAAETEDALAISERFLKQNMEAYEVLAK